MCLLPSNPSEDVFKLRKTITRNIFLDHSNLMWSHSLCRSKEESELDCFSLWYSGTAAAPLQICFQRQPGDWGTSHQFHLGVHLGDLLTHKRELTTKGNGTPVKWSILPAVVSEVLVWQKNLTCECFILPFHFCFWFFFQSS